MSVDCRGEGSSAARAAVFSPALKLDSMVVFQARVQVCCGDFFSLPLLSILSNLSVLMGSLWSI